MNPSQFTLSCWQYNYGTLDTKQEMNVVNHIHHRQNEDLVTTSICIKFEGQRFMAHTEALGNMFV